jgi:uncharacterized protein (DUF1015 family)
MAEVIPFRGIRYNPRFISDLAEVVTPPFDVISAREQQQYYDRHPHNFIRLILGKTFAKDTLHDNRYARAAAYLDSWLKEGIFIQDDAPAFYLTSVAFQFKTKTLQRYGLIALVKLEPFEKGVVLPHEKIFSKVKLDRLDLMKACRVNFSPIFAIYPNDDGLMDVIKAKVSGRKAQADFTFPRGTRHHIWRITDPSLLAAVTRQMKDQMLFIADGHHRYETALDYQAWLEKKDGQAGLVRPADYVMMYLSSMEDPGLIILPAHRMFKNIPDAKLGSFISSAEKFFAVREFPFSPGKRQEVQSELSAHLRRHRAKTIIGVFMKNTTRFYLLSLKPGTMTRLFETELPGVLRNLDVTVLTRLLLIKILGFDQKELDDEKRVGYASAGDQAIEAVAEGRFDIAFILNPTRINQVRQVAEAGLIMPRKSTYFFPKVPAGQVFYALDR